MSAGARSAKPRFVTRLCVATLFAALLAPNEPASGQTVVPSGHHRLIATRTAEPWHLTAGRYGNATDIAAAPDSTLYVLDAVNAAVHVVAGGTPRTVWRVPDAADRSLLAIDFAPDGTLVVLSSCPNCRPLARIDRLAVDGAVRAQMSLDERYRDIAAHPDGRLFLTRPTEAYRLNELEPAVDIYTPDGGYVSSLRDPMMVLPQRVDIAPDGTVHVLHTIPPPPRSGGGGGGGRPLPPGPSGVFGEGRPSNVVDAAPETTLGTAVDTAPDDAPDGVAQAPTEPVSGVIVFAPDLSRQRVIPFDGGIDVGAGDGLAVIAGYGRVHIEGEDTPLTRVVGPGWTGEPHVAVLGPDAVAAALDHCTWQGVLWIDTLRQRPEAPWRLAGALDEPALAGPVAPRRVAAGTDVAVLQDLFAPLADRTEGFTDVPSMAVPPAGARPIQSIQRWTAAGALTDQLGHCAGGRQADWARDVALGRDAAPPAAGPPVYLVDDVCIVQRPNDAFPGWRYCPRGLWGASVGTSLLAVGADANHVAALDAAAAGVVVVDPAGAHVAHWQLGGASTADPTADPAVAGAVASAVDIDVRGGVVALALRGARLVERRTVAGALLGRFKSYDTPDALALGPDGSVYVLGHGGWVTRFSADGTVSDTWSLPGEGAVPTDLAVDDGGRVHVTWQRLAPNGRGDTHQGGGIWVYAPDADVPPVVRPNTACALSREKTAQPARVPLGGEVTITLTMAGNCPAARGPLQLAVVFDRSRSMGWGYTIARAQAAVWATLGALDPATTEVALVAFSDVPAVLSPLTRDLPSVARAVGTLQAAGDTRPGDALSATLDLLAAARRPDVPQALVLVTDGVPYDQSSAALARMAADGVTLTAFIFDNGEDAPDGTFVDELRSRSTQFAFEPSPDEAAALIGAVAEGASPPIVPPLLLSQATIVDRLPDDMRYVAGSAVPPATYDGAARTLTWRIADVIAGGRPVLTFRVVPQQVGVRPTNVDAVADVVDGVGAAGRIVFPVPEVTVFAPRAIYLPFAVREACTRRARPLDVVLAIDTSQSMTEPAGAGASVTKLAAAVAAARAFVDQLWLTGDAATTDRAAIVAFDDAARVIVPLTDDANALRVALAGAETDPGTRLDRGLDAALVALGAARPDARTAVVLLTDGRQNGELAPVVAAAERVRASGAQLHVVGLGADVDAPFLRTLVAAAEAYHAAAGAAELIALYESLSEGLVCR